MSVMALKNRLGNRVSGLQGANGHSFQSVQGIGVNKNLPNPSIGNAGVTAPSHVENPIAEAASPVVEAIDNGITEPISMSSPTGVTAASSPIASSVPAESTVATGSDTKTAAIESIPDVATIQSTPEVTTIESNYLALTTNTIDIINENLKNQPLSYQLFDIVKAPTGGATVFTVPGLTGDEIAKELTGIILDYSTPRAYWETPEPVEGTPPTCYSPDSIVSVDGKPCGTCLYNTFGSKGMNGNGSIGGSTNNNGIVNGDANGNGIVNVGGAGNSNGTSNAKACKESIQALLLLPDSIIPIIIRIPVTSKVIFQKYMTRLVSRMIPLNGVVTKITLEKATSNGGQLYAKFNFEAVEVLTPEEATYARGYGQKFSEMLGASYDVDEGYDDGDNGIGNDNGNSIHEAHNADIHNVHNASNHNANSNSNVHNANSNSNVHNNTKGVL
ncbi:MAG: hypothetical protein FWD97_09490 [Defluviitaleaceae bacterium]|nr:hypothetical protein [Defluviitaleaceae bacterium]